MSFFAHVLKHATQSVVSGLVGAIGSFVAAVIIARTLGVEGTATVAMALWLVFLTTTLSDIGISGTLARFAAECPRTDDNAAARLLAAYLLRLLLRAIAAGMLLTAAILWFYWADILAKYADSPAEGLVFCGLVLLCFVVHMLQAFAYQFLRGLRAFEAIALYSLLGTFLQIGAALIGSLLYGANGGFVAYILFSTPMILSIARVPLRGPIPPPEQEPEIRAYARTFYVASLFSPMLWVRADLLIVDQVMGAEGVGLFAAAATFAALLIQVCQMICNALLPNIVHASRNGGAQFDEASRAAVGLALLLLLPACLIAAAAAPEAVATVFGAEFARGGGAAAVLCLAGLGSALTLSVASVLGAGDGNRALARNGMIGAALTVAGGTLLALGFGLVGAALGRLIAQSAMSLLNLRSANRQVRGLVKTGLILRILLAGSVGALVTEACGWWLGGGILPLLMSLAAGVVGYVIAAVLLLPLGQTERQFLGLSIDKLPPKVRPAARWLLQL